MQRNRGQLAAGLFLILFGAWLVAQNMYPNLQTMVGQYFVWPLNLVAIGAGILLFGLLSGSAGLAVPAAIVAGVGGILYYQQMTEDSSSWSYLWTLIFGFIGVGEILTGLFERNTSKMRSGVNLLMVSAVMFVIAAAIFGKLAILGPYGPAALLILVGSWILIRGFIRKEA